MDDGNTPILIDAYNRAIRSLRVSVTGKCNLNCIYCHREGDREECSSRDMSADALRDIIDVAAEFNIRKLKFSGGEPLLRKDFVDIVASVSDSMDNISVTTNGTLLAGIAGDLADAGMDRVNISLDTLDEAKYKFISRSGDGML